MSQIHSIMHNHDKAIADARRALEISPDGADLQTGLGFALNFAGQYAEGLRWFEGRFAYKLPHYLNFPYARWNGDKIGTLFIAADQGMGDTLSFTRFVIPASMKAERVLFQVQPGLLRMLQHALRHWANIQVIPQAANFPEADAWCPVFSLPVSLGLSTEAIRDMPQRWVVPTMETVLPKDWKAPGRKFHIGIAFAGSPANDIDRWRSIPIEQFLDLYQVGDVQLYSLQVGDRVQDLHLAGAAALVRDMSPWIRDAADTAAIIRDLDLVVTIESFMGHLCGAMGAWCFVPLSYVGGDWRCGRAGDHPLWYPNTTLFRQPETDRGWKIVFDEIVCAVSDLVHG